MCWKLKYGEEDNLGFYYKYPSDEYFSHSPSFIIYFAYILFPDHFPIICEQWMYFYHWK